MGTAQACAIYEHAEGRLAAAEGDVHVVCCAALLGCRGWIFGQQLGCALVGTLGERDDVKRDVAPLIPALARILHEPQASPEINLAAKLALGACTRVDPGWDDSRKANSYFLAKQLDDAGLVAVLARDPYRDEREIIDENFDDYQPSQHLMPDDFAGFGPLLPVDTTEFPLRRPGGTQPPHAPAPAPASSEPAPRDSRKAEPAPEDDTTAERTAERGDRMLRELDKMEERWLAKARKVTRPESEEDESATEAARPTSRPATNEAARPTSRPATNEAARPTSRPATNEAARPTSRPTS